MSEWTALKGEQPKTYPVMGDWTALAGNPRWLATMLSHMETRIKHTVSASGLVSVSSGISVQTRIPTAQAWPDITPTQVQGG